MRGTLTRLSGGHALRTDEVTGEFTRPPTKGKRFEMISEPINPSALARLVDTSPVRSVDNVNIDGGWGWVFETASGSCYSLSTVAVTDGIQQ